MMHLKHQRNEEQPKIITEAKIQMERKTFETDLDMISVIQIVLNRRDIPFYEVWRDISSDLKRDSWRDEPFWYSVLLQAGNSVLLRNKANIQQLLRTFPQLIVETLEDLSGLDIDRLPVRLPDKNLLLAANAGDLPRIIMLYDMSLNPGQKMKNIYHSLLNQKKYDCALQLHERYGGLDGIDKVVMTEHFLHSGTSDEKKRFDRFFCLNYIKNTPEVWYEASYYGVIDRVMQNVLDNGIAPDKLKVKVGHMEFSLKEYLHFLDEMKIQILKYDPWKDVDPWGSEFKRFMKSSLKAAEIFVAWEKDQSEKLKNLL